MPANNTEKIISVKFDSQQAVKGIADLNRQIEQNTTDLNNMAKAGEKGTREYAVLEQQTKSLKTQKRDLSQMVQNEIKQQTTLDGSLRNLRAELSNLTKQYDALSKAERENVNVGGKLKNQINQVTTEIKKAEEGTQRYYRNVGNYQNAILDALGLNGKFSQSIMGLTNMEGGFSGALSNMGTSIKAFGSSLMGLMTNPAFLAIAGIAGAGMAFKWFYDYNEGLAEATRLTREFTGYAGDDLVVMRDKIRATADVMGKDFKETLQTADALMSNFHINGEQAMTIINKGFASGADLNGDMLQKIQQLAPTFHDAGIAADEMVAIISQTRSGIFTDQGLEAIKQGSARIREMSATTAKALNGIGINVDEMQEKLRTNQMTTFDAIKQVSTELKKLPDNAQEVGEVMSAVFGRQGKFASQEMIESLATLSTSLDEVTAKTGQYGELLLEQIDTEEELNKATAAIFDMTNKGWEEAKQKASIYAKKALVAVVKGIIDVTNWFIRLYNQSLIVRAGTQYIILGFKQLWAAAKFVIGVIITGFKNIGKMIEAWVKAFNLAGQAIKGVAEGIAGVFKGIWDLDYDEIKSAVKQIANSAADGATKIFSTFEEAYVNSWKDLAGDFTNFVSDTIENVQYMVNNINGTLDEIRVPAGIADGDITTTRPSSNTIITEDSPRLPDGTPIKKKTIKSPYKDKKSQSEISEEERQKRIQALIKKGAELEKKAYEESAKQTKEGIVEMYKLRAEEINKQFEGIVAKTDEEAKALTKAKNAMLKANLEEQNKALADFAKKEADQRKKETEQAQAEARKLLETQMASTDEGTQARLDYQLQLLRMQKEAELAIYEKNEAMKAAIVAKYAKEEENIRKQNADAQLAIEQAKYGAIAGVVGGIGEVMGAFGEENKEMLILQKTLALAEIMISQAVAIANAVKAGSNAISPWQMIAQIATSVTAVTVAMAQAFKALDEAKFATGGYIKGAGTSTSDSIPVRVSNGESIMNANTTAMFGGLLSSLNQLGGGVPIQVQQTASSVRGEDMLARAVARGVAMLPAPVVSVEDINRGQRQVQVMNERATL